MKREELRQELELKSSEHDEQVQRAFVTALEMQQKSEEEASALKAELARTARINQQKMNALTEQVLRHVHIYATNELGHLDIFWFSQPYAIFFQEKLRREDLRQTLELKSSDRDEKVQRAFAKALEMQQTSAEEAAALKAELARIEHKRQEDVDELAEQVARRRTHA